MTTRITIAVTALCAFFVALGLLGRSKLLLENPCLMTYTTMQKSKIDVDSSVPGVATLYRHPMGHGLNKHPVLFVPGNMGSADQVRSLSSPMHNKDEFFQYFAIQFHAPLSAIHGASLLTQAIFVNDALAAIRDLYEKPVQIMVVGHSVGGMVARTAITMSNHPKTVDNKCLVSDIIMLSTPNVAAAYSPDGSMEAVYQSVNKAWREGHYNESAACKRAKREEESSEESFIGVQRSIALNLKCPTCAAYTRLLSISGGDIDILVPPHLVPAESLAPLARNQTQLRQASSNSQSLLFGSRGVIGSAVSWVNPMSWAKYVYRQAMTAVASGHTNSTETGAIEGIVGQEIDEERQDTSDAATATSDVKKASEKTESKQISRLERFHALTAEEWDEHFTPYKESVQFSIRSVQMKEVGFPIDHNAILWCRQLMGQVSDAMRKLVERDAKARKDGKLSVGSNGMLTKYLPVRSSSATKGAISQAVAEGKKMITPVAAFHLRNATHVAYHDIAGQEDRAYMAKSLPLGYFQAMAVTYATSHLATNILRWYVFLAILVVLAPIRRRISSLRHQDCDDWSVLRLEVMLQLEDILPLARAGLGSVLSLVLPPAVLQSPSYIELFPPPGSPSANVGMLKGGYRGSTYIVVVVLALLARAAVDAWRIGSVPLVLEKYHRPVFHVVSAFTALLLRAVLLAVVYGLRSVVRGTLWCFHRLARYTVYRKGARRALRRLRKRVVGESTSPLMAPGSYLPAVFCSVPTTVVALSFMMGFSNRGPLGTGYWSLLVFSLGVTASTWVGVLRSLLIPPYENSSEAYHLHTSLGMLYLPLLPLSVPSAGFAVYCLAGNPTTYVSALDTFSLFGSSLLNLVISLTAASLHLMNATAYGPAYASLHASVPLEWVAKLLGRKLGASSSSSSSTEARSFSWGGDSDSDCEEEQGFGGTLREGGECFHEDGGRMAIFEEIAIPLKANEIVKASGGSGERDSLRRDSKLRQHCIEPDVVLGSTYRVISCDCAKDWRLKDEEEWCSFCRCKFCGGKDRYRAKSTSGGPGFYNRRDPTALDEVSANAYLVALLGLLAAFAHIYAADTPHRHLYLLGGVAAAFIVRDATVWLGILRP